MTKEGAIEILIESKRQNEIMRDNPNNFFSVSDVVSGEKNARKRIDALDIAIRVLREQQERENPKPLTLDELREMRYGWAWVISNDPDLTVSGWAYISEAGAITIWEYKPDSIVGNVQLRWEDYGKTWLAYRHKPKEEW